MYLYNIVYILRFPLFIHITQINYSIQSKFSSVLIHFPTNNAGGGRNKNMVRLIVTREYIFVVNKKNFEIK